MSIFNKVQLFGALTSQYICEECGAEMKFGDPMETVLVCPECGYSIDVDDYDDEDDDDYPTREEVLGIAGEDDEWDEDNPEGETYDEVCGELDID